MRALRIRRGTVSAGLLLVALAGCGPTSFVITPISTRQALVEDVVLRESIWTWGASLYRW